MRALSETAATPHAHRVSPPPLSPTERADLLLHIEAGRLIVQTPEETEDWHRRRQIEQLMSEALDEVGATRQIAALNQALAEAQGEFPEIPRNAEAGGGSFSYKYATLDAILKAVRPVLAKHGLSLTQPIVDNGAGPTLRTELRHAEGGSIRSSVKLMPGEGPQAFGKDVTYMRRYTITAILGIAAEEDDDGKQAQTAAKAVASPTNGKAPEAPQMISKAQHAKMGAQVKELTEKWPGTEWTHRLREQFHVRSRAEFTQEQASEAIDWLQQHLDVIPEVKDV